MYDFYVKADGVCIVKCVSEGLVYVVLTVCLKVWCV